ncbi:MAG: AraC family transcriptional regulator [Saprospiraceae bacterium]|nr:AraC family transcriptional regulator [Saprospiraceae bacterium]
MEYKTYQPATELSSFIKCIWTLKSSAGDTLIKQRIVPDGCMELIFHFGDPYLQYRNDGTTIVQPRSFVFGQITHALEIEPTGKTDIFAVRFHPDGYLPFATLPLIKMRNKATRLSELFGSAGEVLEGKMYHAANATQRKNICESFLLERLPGDEAIDQIINASVTVILQSQGDVQVAALSDDLHIHRRKLERRFASIVGISPKQLAKIIRLQRTLKMLSAKGGCNLTRLAHESNYYDQAHFIKDFKEFTGQSPKQFYAANLKLSALFYSAE